MGNRGTWCRRPRESWVQADERASKSLEQIVALGPQEIEVKERFEHVPRSEGERDMDPKDRCLAKSPPETRNVALSAVGTVVGKTGSWTRMSRISRIAAEHPDPGSEL